MLVAFFLLLASCFVQLPNRQQWNRARVNRSSGVSEDKARSLIS
jgi:hypothetical protein